MRSLVEITKKTENDILSNLNETAAKSINVEEERKYDAKGKDNNIYFISLPLLNSRVYESNQSDLKSNIIENEPKFALSIPQSLDSSGSILRNTVDPNNVPHLLNSLYIQRRLNIRSPFIQSIIYHDNSGKQLSLKEKCTLKECIDMTKKNPNLNWSTYLIWITELILGLEELHKPRKIFDEKKGELITYHGIAHGDLHSGNILITSSNHLLISDLGKAVLVNESGATLDQTYIPYPNYAVPEYNTILSTIDDNETVENNYLNNDTINHNLQKQKEKYSKVNLKKVDIYQFGQISKELFYCINKESLSASEKLQAKIFTYIISETLSKNPKERPNIDEIKNLINSIKNINYYSEEIETGIYEIISKKKSLSDIQIFLENNLPKNDTNIDFFDRIYNEGQRSLYSGECQHFLRPHNLPGDASNLMPPEILDLKLEFQGLNDNWKHFCELREIKLFNSSDTIKEIIKNKLEKIYILIKNIKNIQDVCFLYQDFINDFEIFCNGISEDLEKITINIKNQSSQKNSNENKPDEEKTKKEEIKQGEPKQKEDAEDISSEVANHARKLKSLAEENSETLLNELNTKAVDFNASAISFLLKNSSPYSNQDLKKLIIFFIKEQGILLDKNQRRILFTSIKDRFNIREYTQLFRIIAQIFINIKKDFLKNEIEPLFNESKLINVRNDEEKINLLNKIDNVYKNINNAEKSDADNLFKARVNVVVSLSESKLETKDEIFLLQQIDSFYSYIDKLEKPEVDKLFNAHLNILVSLYEKGELRIGLLSEFTHKIYPSLTEIEKNLFSKIINSNNFGSGFTKNTESISEADLNGEYQTIHNELLGQSDILISSPSSFSTASSSFPSTSSSFFTTVTPPLADHKQSPITEEWDQIAKDRVKGIPFYESKDFNSFKELINDSDYWKTKHRGISINKLTQIPGGIQVLQDELRKTEDFDQLKTRIVQYCGSHGSHRFFGKIKVRDDFTIALYSAFKIANNYQELLRLPGYENILKNYRIEKPKALDELRTDGFLPNSFRK